jgi:hypothetical protein
MNKKQLRAIVTLATVALVCAPRLALAQFYKVGTFVKCNSSGGTSCQGVNTNTVAHGLPAGVTPVALILWTSSDTFGNGLGRGVSAGSRIYTWSDTAVRQMLGRCSTGSRTWILKARAHGTGRSTPLPRLSPLPR